MEYVNVVLRHRSDSSLATGQVSDKDGKFNFTNVQGGEYFVHFSMVGFAEKSTDFFIIDPRHQKLNLGTITLVASAVKLNEVVVTAEKPLFTTSVDRKVYNVDQDVMSKSGSASELLQNIPSVQVDIDGNVSLRGSTSVSFLVNGKPSSLMDRNSADALQQMPASSIEKIEVITNPSAKYNPEGASGIINIVMKKNVDFGINGNVGANLGNAGRYNGSVRLNYNPGAVNLFGSYSLRKDNRNRASSDVRVQYDSASIPSYYDGQLGSFATPLANNVEAGVEVHADKMNEFGASGNYFANTFTRTDELVNLTRDYSSAIVESYTRNRYDPEYEKEYGFSSYLQHNFLTDEHTLRLEYTYSRSPEQEDNHYSNVYTVPAIPTTYDNTVIRQDDKRNRLTLEYSHPIDDETSLEAGYNGDFDSDDLDFHAEYFDPAQGTFIKDTMKTNQFLYDGDIQALYATFKHSFGDFGFLGGLRAEQSFISSNLVTTNLVVTNNYFNWYPSLHLSLKLTPAAELQLSYSKRTNRPRAEDLNPFPEYRDPRNVSAGNPYLLPEFVHSLEFGCQFQSDLVSVFPSLFYKYTYNRFTNVTSSINDTTLLTTRQNLASEQSGGLEVILSGNVGEFLAVHWNSTAYQSQIDASNLGYSDKKSIFTWTSGLTCNLTLAKGSRFQVNTNYNSARLTPQGEFSPSYVVNCGYRQDLMESKLTLTLTLSDIFKTLKRELQLDTPELNQTVIGTRDSRIIYFGFTYHFGEPPKKAKDDQMKYEDAM